MRDEAGTTVFVFTAATLVLRLGATSSSPGCSIRTRSASSASSSRSW
ncbi:hypothetical protein ACFSTI_12480 [Rhizorhabdus histidinilytica]